MAESEKNKFGGIVVGPIVVVMSISVLWKNEGRFDYHKAAQATLPMTELSSENKDQLVSFTDSMDAGLSLKGRYVESFEGYLEIQRSAEIYCWDRTETENDGRKRVTWELEWMSSVQRNERNRNITQQLNSGQIRPKTYQVGELSIQAQAVEFVDSYVDIPTDKLTLSPEAKNLKVTNSGGMLQLRKNGQGSVGNLGNERLIYTGMPVPGTATYFGKYNGSSGVPHQAQVKDGWIDGLIGDTGILHHLVAGEREIALATMKGHITRLKWIVRTAGSMVSCIGFMMLFGSAVGFLYHLPIIGSVAEWGVFVISLILGLTLSIITILVSYLAHHPIILILFLLMFAGAWILIKGKAANSQQKIKARVDLDMGHQLTRDELAELQFIELLRLAKADQKVDAEERKYLSQWAKRHGWNKEKTQELIQRAKRDEDTSSTEFSGEHLRTLIRLALADGQLHRYELNAILTTAKQNGYSSSDVAKIIRNEKAAN